MQRLTSANYSVSFSIIDIWAALDLVTVTVPGCLCLEPVVRHTMPYLSSYHLTHGLAMCFEELV